MPFSSWISHEVSIFLWWLRHFNVKLRRSTWTKKMEIVLSSDGILIGLGLLSKIIYNSKPTTSTTHNHNIDKPKVNRNETFPNCEIKNVLGLTMFISIMRGRWFHQFFRCHERRLSQRLHNRISCRNCTISPFWGSLELWEKYVKTMNLCPLLHKCIKLWDQLRATLDETIMCAARNL